jgi:hypothetical protein
MEKQIRELEIIQEKLNDELIDIITSINKDEKIKIKLDYYKNLTLALKIIKKQTEELKSQDIMRHCYN